MVSIIYEIKEGDPTIREMATYTLPPKEALINYIHQEKGDMCWWDYDHNMSGIREGKLRKNHFFYNDPSGKRTLSAFPKYQSMSCA